MKAIAYYERLLNHYAEMPDNEPFDAPIEAVAGVLACTRRNAQLVLRRLADEGYIRWLPGRGRGRQSRLVLLLTRRELALRKARLLVEREHIQEAWQLISALQEEAGIAGDEAAAWVSGQFGLKRSQEERDVLRFPFYRPVPLLDPAYVTRRTEAHWLKQIMNTLVDYSRKDKAVMPQLAHHWEADASFQEWTFFLRKGVYFHDGRLFTPDDVVYTFERVLQHSPSDWMKQLIKDVQPAGKHRIKFQLAEPAAAFPNLLCTERFSIVPQGWDGREAGMPVGTGPFRIVKNNESMLALEAHERYFEGRPHLDRIEMWVWPDYEGQPAPDDMRGNAHLLYSEGQLNRGASAGAVLQQLEQGATYLSFNLAKPGPLQDRKLRFAFHYGLDRFRMVEELQGIRVLPACGFVPESERASAAYAASFNPDKAMALVKQSAYAGEQLQLYTYSMRSNEENAAWLQAECAKLGIRLQVVVLPIEQLADPAVIARADLIVAGEVLGEQPDITLIEMYRSGCGYIANHLDPQHKAAAEAQIAACLRQPDDKARLALLQELEEQLKRDCCLLFLHHHMNIVGHDRTLGGISINAWGKINYKDVWIHG
ncbi:ABC transporter substrate-binding protein [Paenibacillus protaetiae]|uniref:SgrR family transcriptional regulator n=1 Tax=Paenibacillus protaetiae TaxID=2509456 RepID=A0A4P6EX50_9BACL|nr:ABC transporter substrate-binding protein [Paenibacillus protaetiae]QAY67612.1 hypothetical protein ET464_15710 [Paenibacillus protaetiae]